VKSGALLAVPIGEGAEAAVGLEPHAYIALRTTGQNDPAWVSRKCTLDRFLEIAALAAKLTLDEIYEDVRF